MDLEDMVGQTEYPVLSLFIIAEQLENVIEEYGIILPKCEERKEFVNKICGLIELIIAVAKHLENIRQEFQQVVDKQYS